MVRSRPAKFTRMKLGLTLGYWGAGPPPDALEKVLEAERLGYDAVFTAESWGSDAFTPLAWWGSRTSRIRLGTSIVQISARTPAACAMTALTLDHLSEGRLILGLGVSGPQVVEGWYGQPFGRPLARTREYITIIRDILAREAPVTNPGPHYPMPYSGPYGWLPIYYSPKVSAMYNGWLAEGFAKRQRSREGFEIATNCQVVVTGDPSSAVQAMKPMLGFYIGGMGARDMNFHKDVFGRMGYEKEVQEVQDLFFEGKRDDAIGAVPDRLVTDISLIGPLGKIRDDLAEWEEAGVTMLVVGARTLDDLRITADAVLG